MALSTDIFPRTFMRAHLAELQFIAAAIKSVAPRLQQGYTTMFSESVRRAKDEYCSKGGDVTMTINRKT
ncbi:MAG: hypothetical protein A3J94_09895 [Syntrophus sp. RIFOXYC2_FULL_54_9]|nr:MAG: hypothetical protein A3J94_09895 [Syntrophus sp. RIFOXYC2_FULL_54_9]